MVSSDERRLKDPYMDEIQGLFASTAELKSSRAVGHMKDEGSGTGFGLLSFRAHGQPGEDVEAGAPDPDLVNVLV